MKLYIFKSKLASKKNQSIWKNLSTFFSYSQSFLYKKKMWLIIFQSSPSRSRKRYDGIFPRTYLTRDDLSRLLILSFGIFRLRVILIRMRIKRRGSSAVRSCVCATRSCARWLFLTRLAHCNETRRWQCHARSSIVNLRGGSPCFYAFTPYRVLK